MYSTSNPTSQFLHLSPSNFVPSPLFLPQNENNNIFLPQQNGEIFQNPKKKTKRKDRHSKIYTAHGLRDRRVRLSIAISRNFFKLQDMLGFEKASETISWLLKNSASAIKELEHKVFSINEGNLEKISHISMLCEEKYGTNVKIKERKINKQNRASNYGPTRESRARARARARERTRAKIMSSTQTPDDRNPSILNRSNNLVSEIEACKGMVGNVINGSHVHPKIDNPLIGNDKDWDTSLFPEFEVLSKYLETFHH